MSFLYSSQGYLSQLRYISNQSQQQLKSDWRFSYSSFRPTPQISDIWDYWYPNLNEHYQYDKLDRLTSWWISPYPQDPPSRKMDVSYDRYGNIVGIVDGTTPYAFNVDPATNRLLTRTGGHSQTSFSYDNAGNATSYGPFDAENRLRSKAGTNYLHDGNGRRFRKQGSSTTNYIYSFSGILLQEDNVTAAAKDDFIYFNGQNVVVHGQNPTKYKVMLRDYHGSVRKSALVQLNLLNLPNITISLCEQYAYDPWGQIISSVQSIPPYTDFRYQNKERDNGLDYFGARNYDGTYPSAASSMRWISPDPVTSNVYDPQSLNKYTYVRNDPVNLVDPDGRLIWMPDPDYYWWGGPSDMGGGAPVRDGDTGIAPHSNGHGNIGDFYRPPLNPLEEKFVDQQSIIASGLIHDPNSRCNSFVTRLLGKASGGHAGPTFTIAQLNSSSANAHYFDGTQSPLPMDNGQTMAELFKANPNVLAQTETTNGSPYIYFNTQFFTSPRAGRTAAPILIHEWVHGIDSKYLTDELLAGILGWNGENGQSGASIYLTNQFQVYCEPRLYGRGQSR